MLCQIHHSSTNGYNLNMQEIIQIHTEGLNDSLDGQLAIQWKNARKQFFTQKIQSLLKESQASQQETQSIYQLFMNEKEDFDNRFHIDFASLGGLQSFKVQIKELQQVYNSMQEQYIKMQRECAPLLKLLSPQQSTFTLKSIKMFFEQKFDSYGNRCLPYSISAFKFFRIIHSNPQLSEVVIKGVQVHGLQHFIKLVNELKHNIVVEQSREELSWMKFFNPSKSLQLSIDALLIFFAEDKKQTLTKANDITFFSKLLQLSNVTVRIRLGEWNKINTWINSLHYGWKSITSLKSIKVQILGQGYQNYIVQEIQQIRSILFGGLAKLRSIAQLVFKEIRFGSQITINSYLAIEQILAVIFDNNKITGLRLFCCSKFPILPLNSTLTSIDLNQASFRTNFDYANQIVELNKQLRSIQCYWRQIAIYFSNSQWSISQALFNQLQVLVVDRNINKQDQIYSEQPSKIKFFGIYSASIQSQTHILMYFRKLYNLTTLSIQGIHCGHQIIITIPSPHLKELRIKFNDELTNMGIKQIDQKWFQLRYLEFKDCYKITESAWDICKFNGLIELNIERQMLGQGSALSNLKRRGIIVNY